jgi:hypothetical protein
MFYEEQESLIFANFIGVGFAYLSKSLCSSKGL